MSETEDELPPPQLVLPLPELRVETSALAPSRVRRIYVNRNLRLDQVDAVGFDMDYTLAIYDQLAMDRLSIDATVKKLVERCGYASELLSMPYRTDFAVRGLLVDKKLGNVVKMDRYRYVKKAYHGMRELTRDERRNLYATQRIRPGTPRYHWVDTLYALSEVSVFAALVDFLEARGVTVDYAKAFGDVRTCIDLAHQDGSIVETILEKPELYVRKDPVLGATLHKLRSAGKKLFLLTNSRPAYTDRMMAHLVGDALPEYPSWRNYFDLIVTGAMKPRFFTEQSPFQEYMDDGTLRDGVTTLERGRVYVGGHIQELEKMFGVGGDRVLYVGDHIYGDVLRAKKESAWRTAMILQEMADEMAAQTKCEEDLDRLASLEQTRDTMYDELRSRQRRFKEIDRHLEEMPADGDGARAELEAARLREKRAIERVRTKLRAVDHEVEALEDAIDKVFHPFWGSIFKAGPEVSIFGDQVEQYACLYTERVSNLLGYSPMHYFRSPRDRMPHEL